MYWGEGQVLILILFPDVDQVAVLADCTAGFTVNVCSSHSRAVSL
jgi:hypothetical protein